MKISRLGASVAVLTALSLGLSACAANEAPQEPGAPGSTSAAGPGLSGQLTGIGASSMASAQETWTSEFQTKNSGVTINYSPDGSGAGREAFAGGGADFAGSDRALKAEEATAEALGSSRCAPDTNAIDLPVYISPIAIIFNLEGVTELNLDASTVAQIFSGKITKWNDPKIADQNKDAKLPDTNITAVHRADDSGTTENFTDYLNVLAPQDWPHEPDGVWPIKGGEAAPQTSGMVDAVTNGTGTIGYADASRAGDLGVAKIKVGDTYVEYSPERAAAVVDASQLDTEGGRSEHDLAYKLDRKATGDVYPIVLVSYAIACEKYQDPKTAELVKAYLGYLASSEGQAAAAEKAGAAPLSSELSTKVAASIGAIS